MRLFANGRSPYGWAKCLQRATFAFVPSVAYMPGSPGAWVHRWVHGTAATATADRRDTPRPRPPDSSRLATARESVLAAERDPTTATRLVGWEVLVTS
jgi:hypothetical protein